MDLTSDLTNIQYAQVLIMSVIFKVKMATEILTTVFVDEPIKFSILSNLFVFTHYPFFPSTFNFGHVFTINTVIIYDHIYSLDQY